MQISFICLYIEVCLSEIQNRQLEMIIQIVFSVLILLVVLFVHSCWIKPKKAMKFYADQLKNHKYRSHILPYKMFKNGVFELIEEGIKQGSPFKVYKEKYPQYDIVVNNIANRPYIELCHVDYIKDFFSVDKHYDYPKIQALIIPFKRLLGGPGLSFSEGHVWKNKKTILNNVLNFEFLVSQIPNIAQVCDNNLKQLQQKNGIKKDETGSYVETHLLQDLMLKIFSQIILSSFFGLTKKHYIEGEEAYQFMNKLTIDLMTHQLQSITPLLGNWFYDKQFRQIDKSINHREKMLKEWGLKLIKQKIKIIENQLKEAGDKIVIDDLIKAVLVYKKKHNLADDDPLVCEDEIFSHFMTFFVGGTDTTSNYTNMMIMYLAKYPEVQEKVREQVNQFMKEDNYTMENLKNFKYIQAVQKQTTRIYGPGNMLLVRQAATDNYINGLAIKKGTLITISPFSNHFSEKYFKEPYQFRPQRWLNGECDNFHPFAVVGFSAGARTCIGKHLALLESKIAIIKIIKRYKNISIPNPNFKTQFKFIQCPEEFKTKLTLSD